MCGAGARGRRRLRAKRADGGRTAPSGGGAHGGAPSVRPAGGRAAALSTTFVFILTKYIGSHFFKIICVYLVFTSQIELILVGFGMADKVKCDPIRSSTRLLTPVLANRNL